MPPTYDLANQLVLIRVLFVAYYLDTFDPECSCSISNEWKLLLELL